MRKFSVCRPVSFFLIHLFNNIIGYVIMQKIYEKKSYEYKGI